MLDPHISTRGEMGHVVLTVLGMVAQMERRFIKERQREGIDRAKSEGRYAGGKRRVDRAAVLEAGNCARFRASAREMVCMGPSPIFLGRPASMKRKIQALEPDWLT